MRVLLAEEDDTNAFLLHCEINRLSRPTTFRRASAPDTLREALGAFRPDHLILAGQFARAGEVRSAAALAQGIRIVCLCTTSEDADAAMEAGADDCLLITQRSELAACLDAHLNHKADVPFYRVHPGNGESRLERTERALQRLDEALGDWLKPYAIKAVEGWKRIGRETARVGAETQARCRKFLGSVQIPSWFGRDQPLKSTADAPGRELLDGSVPVVRANFLAHGEDPDEENADLEALRTLELSFKILFNAIFDAVFLLDHSGRILHLNPSGCTLVGLPAAEALGRRFVEFVPREKMPQAIKSWDELLLNGRTEGTLQLLHPSGGLRDAAFTARANLWYGVHLLIASPVPLLTAKGP